MGYDACRHSPAVYCSNSTARSLGDPAVTSTSAGLARIPAYGLFGASGGVPLPSHSKLDGICGASYISRCLPATTPPVTSKVPSDLIAADAGALGAAASLVIGTNTRLPPS